MEFFDARNFYGKSYRHKRSRRSVCGANLNKFTDIVDYEPLECELYF